MELLKVRRLPVINKSKRMVGMISLGDVGQFAAADLPFLHCSFEQYRRRVIRRRRRPDQWTANQ